MIELKDITLKYGKQLILDGVSLKIKAGEIKAILGPSGSGKSTIIRLMLGLIKPTTGSVFVDGVDITEFSEKELYPIRQKMGIVFQGNALFDSLTAAENIGFFLRENLNIPEHEIKKRVQEQIDFSGLYDYMDALPENLSGGMKKRVAIARALIFQPKMILFDEPTAGLDPVSANRILDLVLKMNREIGLGAVLVTHIIGDVKTLAESVVVLYQKKIIFDGATKELWSSKHPFIESFLSNEEKLT